MKQWEPNTCQSSITSHKTGIKAFSCSTLKTGKTCSFKYLLAIRLHHVTSKKTLLFLTVVGIMTCCRLDGPAFDLWWRQEIFCSPCMSRLALGPTYLLYNGHRGSLPRVKHSGCGSDHPLPPSISWE